MFRLKLAGLNRGWAMLEAIMALGLWGIVGTSLMMQTTQLMKTQHLTWREEGGIEWQADLFERLRMARSQAPIQLDWGQTLNAGSCVSTDCTGVQWRDSLVADWQTRLLRDWPQAQTRLMPWASDPRLQIVGIRWPDPDAVERNLPMNQVCPAGWQCLLALGWP